MWIAKTILGNIYHPQCFMFAVCFLHGYSSTSINTTSQPQVVPEFHPPPKSQWYRKNLPPLNVSGKSREELESPVVPNWSHGYNPRGGGTPTHSVALNPMYVCVMYFVIIFVKIISCNNLTPSLPSWNIRLRELDQGLGSYILPQQRP